MNNPVVIVGSGIAGLNFALKVAERFNVLLLTKSEIKESSTYYAQGGIASVLGAHDSFESHIEDTLKAGSYHNDKGMVEFMVKNGPAAINGLIANGVDFDEADDGHLALAREGGHSANRIAHKADYTGKEIEESLIAKVFANPKIKIIENAYAVNLIVRDGRVGGLEYISDNKLNFVSSSAVVLCTGGIGRLYKYTSNPLVSTGDGIAMAYRVGAKVKDMEFVQFHPTCFRAKDGSMKLISEAVRGEGAHLTNLKGRFVNELSPRDEVALAIYKQSESYLDLHHLETDYITNRFPSIYKMLKENGVDMAKDLIPVQPAAHYACGGIEIDKFGRTSVDGLYAFGECACTGVHGANRLASNSLLEALVFSNSLAENLEPNQTEIEYEPSDDWNLDWPAEIVELQELMWNKVGVVRNTDELKEALDWIKSQNPGKSIIYTNALTVAELIVEAALSRTESLGCHIIKNSLSR